MKTKKEYVLRPVSEINQEIRELIDEVKETLGELTEKGSEGYAGLIYLGETECDAWLRKVLSKQRLLVYLEKSLEY